MIERIIHKLITTVNRWRGRFFHRVKFIVYHYTANDGDTAENNAKYFYDTYRGASAHYFVDENEIWQSVEEYDTAWAVGDGASRNGCNNYNSISIEMCSRVDADGNYYFEPRTLENGIALGHKLLARHPDAVICRHYDVTGKRCPRPFVDDERSWEEFKNKVEEGRPMTKEEKAYYDAKIAALERKVAPVEESINWAAHITPDVGGDEAKAMMADLSATGDFKGISPVKWGWNKLGMRILLIIYRMIKRIVKLNGLRWK